MCRCTLTINILEFYTNFFVRRGGGARVVTARARGLPHVVHADAWLKITSGWSGRRHEANPESTILDLFLVDPNPYFLSQTELVVVGPGNREIRLDVPLSLSFQSVPHSIRLGQERTGNTSLVIPTVSHA